MQHWDMKQSDVQMQFFVKRPFFSNLNDVVTILNWVIAKRFQLKHPMNISWDFFLIKIIQWFTRYFANKHSWKLLYAFEVILGYDHAKRFSSISEQFLLLVIFVFKTDY